MPLVELEERRVYYEEHGDGEPLLLINGLGADHTTWDLQTAFLSKHSRVINFDPGIGQTEGPRGPYPSALFADVHPQSAEAFSDQAEACVGHEALEEIASAKAPTLIAVGDGDLTPASHSFEIKARMPKSALQVWPEMGHAPFREIPAELNELSYGFLRAH